MEATRTESKQLLIQYYKLNPEKSPKNRERSKWIKENKFGFLLGIVEYGQDSLVNELYNLLKSKEFKRKEKEIIDKMYDFQIRVFKQHNGTGSSCHTPIESSSMSNSVEDLDYIPKESNRKLEHLDLKKAVSKRDGVCLFCWDSIQCQAAHIVAQKDVPFQYDEPSLFERTGLRQKHQVQNGLLLCIKCHAEFGALKRYVDVVDDMLVLKVINKTPNENEPSYLQMIDILISNRVVNSKYMNTSRKAVESNGEMGLYFLKNDPSQLPNRKALEFHKAACLIWQRAGGAEPEHEYCPDDNDDELIALDYRKEEIQKWREDSMITLNTEFS